MIKIHVKIRPSIGVKFVHYEDYGTIYTITGVNDKMVRIEWVDARGPQNCAFYDMEQVEHFLKEGTWIEVGKIIKGA